MVRPVSGISDKIKMTLLRLRLLPLLALVLVTLAGCASAPRVSIVAESGANQNASTALDFVVVYDAGLLATLPTDSATWFAQKNTLLGQLGPGIHVVSLEVPPGMMIESVTFPKNTHRATAVFYYANYANPAAQARGSIRTDADVTLRLEAGAVRLSSR